MARCTEECSEEDGSGFNLSSIVPKSWIILSIRTFVSRDKMVELSGTILFTPDDQPQRPLPLRQPDDGREIRRGHQLHPLLRRSKDVFWVVQK